MDLKETAAAVEPDRQSPKEVRRIQGRRSMLKSIDPILNADVLYALRAMGHGDDLVISDANFPADAVARQTVLGRLLRIDNVTAGRAARAILSVLPLDSFVDKPALRMQIVGKPDDVPPVQIEVQREIDAAQGGPLPMGSIERFAFYELAKKSYCVIQTGERRFYGCFVFKKGVIAPDPA
jgi:L-fucose mutarotase